MNKTVKAKKRIFIVEDDAAILEALSHNLRREGYEVQAASDGALAIDLIRRSVPDLVLLDLMLPSLEGTEVCKELRTDPVTKSVPIIMLTARADEVDQVVGFSVGADDYVTKPFSIKVLLQRIKVLLARRQQAGREADTVTLHGIRLDRLAHQACVDDEPVPLTPTEYRLLETLMRQPGRAFSRSDLLDWAVGDDTIVLERTIDVHIRSLRRKLDRHADCIETVRGVGYRFARELAENLEHE